MPRQNQNAAPRPIRYSEYASSSVAIAAITLRWLKGGGDGTTALEKVEFAFVQRGELRRLNGVAARAHERTGRFAESRSSECARFACSSRAVGIEVPCRWVSPVITFPLEIQLQDVRVAFFRKLLLQQSHAALHLIAEIVHGEKLEFSMLAILSIVGLLSSLLALPPCALAGWCRDRRANSLPRLLIKAAI